MNKIHPLTGYIPRKAVSPQVRTGGQTGKIGSFGLTRVRADGTKKMHEGVDWLVRPGTPCWACFDGRVVERYGLYEKDFGGYGIRFYLVSKVDPDYVALYAHLGALTVFPGQDIPAGMLVGWTGRTGNMGFDPSLVPDHLHFGVKHRGQWTDPEFWLYGAEDGALRA